MNKEAALLNARYELKFNSKSSEYYTLRSWVLNHPLAFSPLYYPRLINNIYFDNYDLEAFHENLTGISSRTKLRLRWYGKTSNPNNTTLELKLRKNLLGWKISSKVEMKESSLENISWRCLENHIKNQIPKDLALHYDTSPFAVLMNRYEREYFISANNKVRITLDKNIRFYDQRFKLSMNKSFINISPDMVIMEVKVNASDFDEAEKLTKDVYIQRTKNSKYVVGVCSILGY